VLDAIVDVGICSEEAFPSVIVVVTYSGAHRSARARDAGF